MQEHKTTKLVQANTIACSSSAILEQHARLARHARLDSLDKVERVESCRDEPSGIWAYVIIVRRGELFASRSILRQAITSY